MAHTIITPHGGKLVNRIVEGDAKSAAGAEVSIKLTERQQCDLEMLAVGAMSPLTGFVGKADYDAICSGMRLANGTAWPIPVTCSVDKATAGKIKVGQKVGLLDDGGNGIGFLTVEEKYDHDKKKQAETVFKTTETAHPGVKVLMEEGDVCLAGPVEAFPKKDVEFADYRLAPAATREAFKKHGWGTVVAFQTRNPIHRAHEYLTKCALEICDGLLIHPLVGQTQPGDIPADVRMRCYTTLIEKYYNTQRTMLSVMPAAMRYAGPREAILHAVVRQNYGCSHFIVGRDHAGVGTYYGTYDAQEIFGEYKPGELGITPLNFEHSFFCKKTKTMASDKTTNSAKEDRVFLSGTKVRDMLAAGERPPEEFTRPEIADILIASMKS